MNKAKKIIAAGLLVVSMLALTACQKTETPDNSVSDTSSVSSVTSLDENSETAE